MAWTSPRTWSIGEKITAAIMNTHVRDNLAYLYNLLTGAAAGVHLAGGPSTTLLIDKAATPSTARFGLFVGDGTNWNSLATVADENYFSAINTNFHWISWPGSGSAVELLKLDTAGKLTGKGFYDSGDVTVTNGSTQSFTHGLSAQPRFYSGQHNAGSGVARFPVAYVGAGGTTVAFVAVDSANVQIVNNSGGSRQVRACAML